MILSAPLIIRKKKKDPRPIIFLTGHFHYLPTLLPKIGCRFHAGLRLANRCSQCKKMSDNNPVVRGVGSIYQMSTKSSLNREEKHPFFLIRGKVKFI